MNNKGETSGGNAREGFSDDSSEEEEQDEPSSSSNKINKEVEDVLENFREKWQKELQISSGTKNLRQKSVDTNLTLEQEAQKFFIQGSEMEKNGQLYDAIKYYRRAVQLVPDIEFKIEALNKSNARERQLSENLSDSNEKFDDDSDKSDDEDDIIKEGFLLPHIQRKMNKTHLFCLPKFEQKTTHISVVPGEILLYILKWVVSSELDVRSLEMCAQVSRGFYLLSRDSEIWKLICRAGGLTYDKLPGKFLSWREMYLECARIYFNGCYISKTTYVRHGENSFQDQSYRPCYLVAYYRYLRFFPDGRVLMLNTPDEPTQCVSVLRHRSPKLSSILVGHFLLHDDRLTIVVQHQEATTTSATVGGRKGRRQDIIYDTAPQTFHLELQIQNFNTARHSQLTWRHYSVATHHRNGTDAHCTFDIDMMKFPPLRFSRVKSYTQESYTPLA